MYINRDLVKHSAQELKALFFKTTQTVYEELGENAFIQNKRVNIALLESILVTTSRKILKRHQIDIIKNLRDELVTSNKFYNLNKSHTSSKKNVFERFNLCFNFVEEVVK